MDESERMKLGRRAAYVGIGGNIFLTAFNFTVGLSSGSVALVAEAAHTLSDVLTSVITYIGFRVGQRPPDKQHPYGHGRAEALVGLVVVVFLGIVSYEIISEAYRKLFIETAPPDYTAAVMAGVGVIANIVMTMYIMRMGKRINSPAIMADAQHQKVDIFSCVAIMVGVLGSRLGLGFLDPLVAVFIAIMVLKTAFDVGRENINNILGAVPSEELMEDIEKSALSVAGVQGIHEVRINYFGPYASVDVHIEVDGDMKLRDAHEIAHTVERQVIDDIDIIKIVNVHVCPYGEKSGCVDWSEA
ncbi:cation diffusion facilitator family transporter [Methanothermobacter wolfeii]|uniref:Cation diffusion facilitator family transporter n=1 Tax=Methanothermobacter wolfeii TaxID=145261 RepID=A0A9E7RTU4_METWO|nr:MULTISPECIES: cation diffusion facilitator family transporter [Methanothermobacter]MDI6702332.1 cation diffusion facilitator family transporter [Methanothermobacter wolfeii]QHN05959.1 cation transporter [Methanothermobacter sp. THM-1]UXH32126.1 cation diffusion facilitator family transporter [Methanothermobacter wolfeii]HIH70998.1 cation transporter [Methanothermobacter thermautotrophicus]